jgi:hypothetical protein
MFAFCGFTAAQSVPDTQALDDGRQWLDSRSLPTPTAPALVRAAAANARNQSAVSESLLLSIVQSQPASDSARRAHELLSRIYLRSGQYRRAIANLDQWPARFLTILTWQAKRLTWSSSAACRTRSMAGVADPRCDMGPKIILLCRFSLTDGGLLIYWTPAPGCP